MRTHYEVLGVERTDNANQIRVAYIRIARTAHPDKNPNTPENPNRNAEATAAFQPINAAHEILKDPVKRAAYDRVLDEAAQDPTVSRLPNITVITALEKYIKEKRASFWNVWVARERANAAEWCLQMLQGSTPYTEEADHRYESSIQFSDTLRGLWPEIETFLNIKHLRNAQKRRGLIEELSKQALFLQYHLHEDTYHAMTHPDEDRMTLEALNELKQAIVNQLDDACGEALYKINRHALITRVVDASHLKQPRTKTMAAYVKTFDALNTYYHALKTYYKTTPPYSENRDFVRSLNQISDYNFCVGNFQSLIGKTEDFRRQYISQKTDGIVVDYQYILKKELTIPDDLRELGDAVDSAQMEIDMATVARMNIVLKRTYLTQDERFNISGASFYELEGLETKCDIRKEFKMLRVMYEKDSDALNVIDRYEQRTMLDADLQTFMNSLRAHFNAYSELVVKKEKITSQLTALQQFKLKDDHKYTTFCNLKMDELRRLLAAPENEQNQARATQMQEELLKIKEDLVLTMPYLLGSVNKFKSHWLTGWLTGTMSKGKNLEGALVLLPFDKRGRSSFVAPPVIGQEQMLVISVLKAPRYTLFGRTKPAKSFEDFEALIAAPANPPLQ